MPEELPSRGPGDVLGPEAPHDESNGRQQEAAAVVLPQPSQRNIGRAALRLRISGGDGAPLSLLSSHELELFSHYIMHASRAIASDQDDLFALHVGIPNLALTTPAVMGSVLALSAACKCNDILNCTSEPLQHLEEVRDHLLLADKHHRASLEQLQEAISQSNFNAVLANAALMVLYALSNHCVRVRIAMAARAQGETLPQDLLPTQSQWITSIRAAYAAYVGLQNSSSDLSPSPNPRLTEAEESHLLGTLASDPGFVYQDGPSEQTKRLLLPIVSASYTAALQKLRLRCEEASRGEGHHLGSDVCLASLTLLEEVFETILGNGPPPNQNAASSNNNVSNYAYPWLARYLSRVTSASPSKLSRRASMSFLNRVPAQFLHLVQTFLDLIYTDSSLATLSRVQNQDASFKMTHLPAMDIFAHWLVLVMLVDGVWWIGDIGHWELGRIVATTSTCGWMPHLTEGGTWWPETMYALKSTVASSA